MSIRRWGLGLGTALSLAALLVAGGCSRPADTTSPGTGETATLRADVAQLQAENDKLKQEAATARELEKGLRSEIEQLTAKVVALSTNAGRPAADLINSHYQGLGADSPGVDYVKSGSYDLDGDGTAEKLVLLTTAQWVDKVDTFAWDDGHNWQVYVEEPNGTRTYLFNRWVQMGRLTAMVAGDRPDVLIVQQTALSFDVYRVHYRGAEPPDARLVLELPVGGYIGFANPKYHD